MKNKSLINRRLPVTDRGALCCELLERRILFNVGLTLQNHILNYTELTSGVNNNGRISVDSAGTTLTITEQADTIVAAVVLINEGWTVSPDGHTASGPESFISSINVDTGDGADTLVVASTDKAVTIKPTSAGSTALTVGGVSGVGAQQVTSPVTFDGTNATGFQLSIDDTGDTQHQDPTIRAQDVLGLSPGPVSFTPAAHASTPSTSISLLTGSGGTVFVVQQQTNVPSTDSVTISGNGNNTIDVEALSANNFITLDPASGGSDNVLMGSSNQVDGLQGEVFVTGQQTTSQITINDSADPTAHSLDLVQDLSSSDPNSNMAFQVDGRSLISFVDNEVNAFTLNSGTGANKIHTGPVGDFLRGFTITLNTNGAGTQMLLDVLPVSTIENINDSAGSSELTVQSGGVNGDVVYTGSSDNSDALNVLSDEVSADTAFQITGDEISGLSDGGFVVYTHIGSVSVTGGSGFDNFSVEASPTTSYTINGGPSNTTPTDRLQVSTTGQQPELDLSADSSGDHGTFTFRDRQPVTFSRVGEVTPTFGVVTGTVFNEQNLNPAVGVTVVADANNNGVVDAGEKTAITSSDGTFLFAGLDTGTYGLLIQNAGINLLTPTSVNVTSGGARLRQTSPFCPASPPADRT